MFIYQDIIDRKGLTYQWLPSDKLENYLPTNGTQPNYTKDEFEYKFNSDGFRCDEFKSESDLPILFAGCSFTEGIGLPLEEIWITHILNNIKSLPKFQNKKIPLWSIAAGGSGPDLFTELLFNNIDNFSATPKYVIYLMCSHHRRSFCLQSNHIRNWAPTDDVTDRYVPLFIDNWYALYQFRRNLQLISLIAEKHQTRIYIFDLSSGDDENKIKICNEFKNIEYKILTNDDYKFPTYLNNRPEKARDNLHPGAKWQYSKSIQIWQHIKHEFV